MRTPILIQTGSLKVWVEEQLVEKRVAQRWRYVAFRGRGTIDAVTWDGRRWQVWRDREPRRPGGRDVRIWASGVAAGEPALEVTTPGNSGRFEIRPDGRLCPAGRDGEWYVYQYLPDPRATCQDQPPPSDPNARYALEVAYPGPTRPSVRVQGVQHLAIVVNDHLPAGLSGAKLWACLALGAGVGVVGGLLLKARAEEKAGMPD
jgi:hypothetical protein